MRTTIVLTIIGSLCLIATGVGFYLGTGASSITALIPAFMGAPLLACGLIALKPATVKVTMHISAVIVLLGALGTTRVFMKWAALTPAARSAQLITFLICSLLLAIYIGSFIKARRPPTG